MSANLAAARRFCSERSPNRSPSPPNGARRKRRPGNVMKQFLNKYAQLGLIVMISGLLSMTGCTSSAQQESKPKDMSEIRLMTLDPGHFHAALVQKETLAGVSPKVDVYGPLGFDLIEHLRRVSG